MYMENGRWKMFLHFIYVEVAIFLINFAGGKSQFQNEVGLCVKKKL